MRVVHIMASSEIGGGAKYLELVLPELRALGVENSVVTSPGGPMVHTLRSLNIPVHTPVDMMRHRISARASWRLRRFLTRGKPDLVHFHGTRAAFQGALIPKRFPSIYTSHGAAQLPKQDAFRRTLMRAVERYNARRVKRYTGVSKRDIEAILGRWAPDAYVPNPVDPRFLAPEPLSFDSLQTTNRRLRLGTVGRLVPQKGIETLIDAVAELRSQIDVELHIVGGGPLLSSLKHQAKELKLNPVFHGALVDPLPVLESLDVFVAPSRWEGQPLSVLEALAAGIPTVLSDCPGLRELADELDLRFVFPTDDAAVLAEEILRVIHTPHDRLKTDLNRLVAAMRGRTPARTARLWLDIYRVETTT